MSTMGGFGHEQLEREAKGFRPSSTPLLVMVVGNLLLATVFLGIPYYLGRQQAKASLSAFADFAACFLDAEPNNRRGLGMPNGEAPRFAGRVLNAAPDWPGSCKKRLDAVAPEEAIFLWPSVKQAAADVRAIVGIFQHELDAVAELRAKGPAGRVPERPLLALAKLRAGLTLLARAAGTDGALDEDAVRFTSDPGVVEPAHLPLMAGSDATLNLRMGQDGVEALAVDARGVSWLQVEGGELERRRFARTSLVRGTLPTDDTQFVVWAMPRKRCAEREDHCARNATGVAAFDAGGVALPDPIWLAGHPFGRFDRALRVIEGEPPVVEMLALSDTEGHVELRRFTLIAPVGEKPPPLPPTERHELPGDDAPTDALLLPAGEVLYTVLAEDESTVVRLWRPATEDAPIEIARLAGQAPWLAHCAATDEESWIVYGSDRQLGAATLAPAQAPIPAQLVDVSTRAPIDPEDRAGDKLRVVCEHAAVSVLTLDPKRQLQRVRCDHAACRAPHVLAREVRGFDAAAQDGTLHVAYTCVERPEIVTLRLVPGAAAGGHPSTPAVCWEPRAGMCGQPTLLASSTRLLLAARDRADLLAIESNDGGKTWTSMSGLKVHTAISTDAASPMDQHRIRKGID